MNSPAICRAHLPRPASHSAVLRLTACGHTLPHRAVMRVIKQTCVRASRAGHAARSRRATGRRRSFTGVTNTTKPPPGAISEGRWANGRFRRVCCTPLASLAPPFYHHSAARAAVITLPLDLIRSNTSTYVHRVVPRTPRAIEAAQPSQQHLPHNRPPPPDRRAFPGGRQCIWKSGGRRELGLPSGSTRPHLDVRRTHGVTPGGPTLITL